MELTQPDFINFFFHKVSQKICLGEYCIVLYYPRAGKEKYWIAFCNNTHTHTKKIVNCCETACRLESKRREHGRLALEKKQKQKIYTFSALKRAGIHDGKNLWQNVWARNPAVRPGRAGAKSPKTTFSIFQGFGWLDFLSVVVLIKTRASFFFSFYRKLYSLPVRISPPHQIK